MKVVLTKDIPNVGKKGSEVDVSDGYARNYLFPKQIAFPAHGKRAQEILKEIEMSRKAQGIEAQKKLQAQTVLQDHVFVFVRRASESSSLYKGVTLSEISLAVSDLLGVSIPVKNVSLPGPVRMLGESKAAIKLGSKIIQVRLLIKKELSDETKKS